MTIRTDVGTDALLWEQADWLDEAVEWIEGELARLGRDVTGQMEQPHVRPWSTVLRVPTAAGDLWFKACMPALAHEVAVVEVLSRRCGDSLPELLAADAARGWMLQTDAGERVRELADPERWVEILPRYAGLQVDAAEIADELRRVGAPDRGLAALPAAFEDLLRRQRDLEPGAVTQLRERIPRIAELCDELAALGLPETIQHDDLHSGNVFVRDGRYLFIDWGDACLAHPFLTLHVTLRVLAYELGLPEDARELDRFRDAYLEPWTAFRPADELVAALPAADLLGALGRALNWQLVAEGAPPADRGEYDEDVADRLRLLAERL
ncbi:MAG: phosphotransferase [Gaiellaceae bacterium]